jgi:hypothetical protein
VVSAPAGSAGQAKGHSWAECSDWLYNLKYKNCDTVRGRRSRALKVLFQSVKKNYPLIEYIKSFFLENLKEMEN